jgi:hypothetical protein
LKCCLNIDKKHIPKPVSTGLNSVFRKGLNSVFRKPKPFERRGLDEKVGSFVYMDCTGVGFVFLFDGIEI